MKRIWNAIGKQTKDANYQQKAIKHADEISKGNVRVVAPRHASEKAHIEKALKNETIKKAVSEKNADLIDKMNKFNIKSTTPAERWTSSKDLPTRELEYLHRNDPVWEFGFYEPAKEKIPKDKLTFREALEVLRARQELEDDGSSPASAKRRETAKSVLNSHPATERVESSLIDDMYQYFRPFERKDTQKVVSKADLAQLQDILKGHSDEMRLTDGARDNIRALLQKDKKATQEYDGLDSRDKEKFREAVKLLRDAEHKRLNERLADIHKMDHEVEVAAKEAKEVYEKKKKEREGES